MPSSTSLPRAPVAWAAAALLAVHIGVAFFLRSPGLTTAGDDSTYLLLGRSLRDLQYVDQFLVGAPVEAQYPPLYPATLALIGAVFGERLELFIAASIVFSAAALLVVFLGTLPHSRPLAFIGLTLGAVNLDLLRMAGTIRSEPLFMLLVAGALVLLAKPDATRRSLACAGALAIAAALTRSAGVAVVAAVLTTWLVQRRWRPASWLVAASLVTLGPWLAWTVVAPGKLAGRSYVADLLLPGPPAPSPPPPAAIPSPQRSVPDSSSPPSAPPSPIPGAGQDSTAAPATAVSVGPSRLVATLWHRVTTNLARYASRGVPDALGLPRVPGTDLDNWLWLIVLVAAGVAGLWRLSRWWPAAAATLIGYGLLLAVWPYTVGRFLTPMLPLAILALVTGSAALASRFGFRRPIIVPLAFAVLVLIGSLPPAGRALRQSAQCDRDRATESAGCFDQVERAFFSAIAFIADSTPSTARFLTAKEAVFYYYTGRQVAPLPPLLAARQRDVRGYLSRLGADYILLSHLKYDEWALIGPLNAMCRDFELVRRFGPGTVLLRIDPPSEPEGEEACEAIREYDRTPWGSRLP
ncbi:MAG: hypothetical protein ACKVZ0_09900 [Gemmatimonadales bacterium]